MARIRTIKPEFWQNEKLSELPCETHMLAAALINYADDEGYFNANPKLVKSCTTPLRDDSVTVHGSLIQLEKIGYIRVGKSSDGKTIGHIVNFLDHQVINRPKPSKIKDLDIKWNESLNNHGIISDSSSLEGKGREGNMEHGIRKGIDKESITNVIPKKSEKNEPLKPDDVSDGCWEDFVAHRKKHKAAITSRVIIGIRKEADLAGITLQEALDMVVMRGWMSFQASWVTENSKNFKDQRNDRDDKKLDTMFSNSIFRKKSSECGDGVVDASGVVYEQVFEQHSSEN